jgi:hypothetical protein
MKSLLSRSVKEDTRIIKKIQGVTSKFPFDSESLCFSQHY